MTDQDSTGQAVWEWLVADPRPGTDPATWASVRTIGSRVDTAGYIRRARRLADLSQRDLAGRIERSAAGVGRLETGTAPLTVSQFEEILAVGGLRLVVVDEDDLEVEPMQPNAERDRASRRYPAHLDAVIPDFAARNITPLQRHREPPNLTFRWRAFRDLGRAAAGTPDDHPTPTDLHTEAVRRRER